MQSCEFYIRKVKTFIITKGLNKLRLVKLSEVHAFQISTNFVCCYPNSDSHSDVINYKTRLISQWNLHPSSEMNTCNTLQHFFVKIVTLIQRSKIHHNLT